MLGQNAIIILLICVSVRLFMCVETCTFHLVSQCRMFKWDSTKVCGVKKE